MRNRQISQSRWFSGYTKWLYGSCDISIQICIDKLRLKSLSDCRTTLTVFAQPLGAGPSGLVQDRWNDRDVITKDRSIVLPRTEVKKF